MALGIRQREIIEIARRDGRVVVEDLAARFNVSVQTIRRDLSGLDDLGLMDRVHGGAVPVSGAANLGYDQRRVRNAAAKEAIGRACAARIPDNCSLILGIGTTTEAAARALRSHRNLTVITNNMNVANTLIENESCEVIVAGGCVRRSDGALTGDLTQELIRNFKVDHAIIGCSGLDSDGDILDFDLAEVRVSRTILSQARSRWLITDLSKLGQRAPARVAALTELSHIVTDAPLPEGLSQRCASAGVECIVAEPGGVGARGIASSGSAAGDATP